MIRFFSIPLLRKPFAQLTESEKNGISHRGKAMKELRAEMDKVIIWLKQRISEEPF